MRLRSISCPHPDTFFPLPPCHCPSSHTILAHCHPCSFSLPQGWSFVTEFPLHGKLFLQSSARCLCFFLFLVSPQMSSQGGHPWAQIQYAMHIQTHSPYPDTFPMSLTQPYFLCRMSPICLSSLTRMWASQGSFPIALSAAPRSEPSTSWPTLNI